MLEQRWTVLAQPLISDAFASDLTDAGSDSFVPAFKTCLVHDQLPLGPP